MGVHYQLCKVRQCTFLPPSLKENINNNTYFNCHIPSSHLHLSYSSPNRRSHCLCILPPLHPDSPETQVLLPPAAPPLVTTCSSPPQPAVPASPSSLRVCKSLFTHFPCSSAWVPYLFFTQGPGLISYQGTAAGPPYLT